MNTVDEAKAALDSLVTKVSGLNNGSRLGASSC